MLIPRPGIVVVGLLLALMALCPFAVAQESSTATAQTKSRPPIKTELEGFGPFVGTWVIDGQWIGGNKLWAKNEYSVGMNGNFIEARTFAKNQYGKIYQRYLTIWRFNPDKGSVESYGFTYDGTVTVTDSEIDNSDPAHPVIRSQWAQPDGSRIKQEVRHTDADSYAWKVWSSSDGSDWKLIMDGVWKRQN